MVRQWCDPDPGSILYIGDHIIVCYAEDNHGNQESCSFGVEVLDNEPPSISCPGRKVRSMDWDQDNAQIWFLGEVQAWDNSEYQPIIECNPREGYFSMGETEVECTATDQAGNERGCKFGVNVYDSQQPTIVCPSDIYAKRDPDEAGTNVDWAVQGWDNADDSPDVNCRPDQQHVFLFGTTTVSCVAADESNNRGFVNSTWKSPIMMLLP
ncbi:hyalin-like [Amphiura filiformis]|uniref:hyalin-like n=1 Tax=Amphiura filiformis TaxID=82378 RepID=UPI003B225738